MYLVQAISNLKKGYVNIDPNSHVTTKAMNSIKDFLNQRIRWSSNSKSTFKNTRFFMFLIVSFFENLLILSSIILFKKGFVIWGIKIIVDGIVILFRSKLFEKS